MGNDALRVGIRPRPLSFDYVLGYPLSFSIIYKVGDPKVSTPWPEAPVMFFGDPEADDSETFTKTATLTASDGVEGAKASWNFTALEIHTIDELPDESAAITVQDMPWWKGQATRG